MTGFELIAEQKARERNLPWPLVKGLIKQESAWNENALGPPTKWGQARGLMQLIPTTAQMYGVNDPNLLFNPEVNIEAGTRHLARLAKRYEGDPDQWQKVTAAYNTGEGRVPRDQPFSSFFSRLPAETRNYVTKIMGPVSAHQPTSSSLFDLTRRDIRPATTLPPDPSRQTELRQSQPPSTLETLYNYVFGTENEGLPPAKMWPGPEVGEPPDQITTGDLATLGLLAMSGMGAALPSTVGRALPALLQTSPGRAIGNLALGTGGSAAGREIGEAVAGETGGNIGAGVGGLLSLPTKRPPVVKSDIYSIPAEGPLEGTAVRTRQGFARPMAHGTGEVYSEFDVTKTNPHGLYGPGHYFTTAGENVASGYASGALLKERKLLRQLEDQAAQANKKALIERAKFRQQLTPEERSVFDNINWNTNRASAVFDDILGDFYKRRNITDTGLKSKNPFVLAARRVQQTTSNSKMATYKASARKDKVDELPSATPNIRPVYLNIKNPFDIDKKVPPDAQQRIADALEKNKPTFTNMPEHIKNRNRLDVIIGFLRKGEEENGESLHLLLEDHLGSKADVNRVLADAGYDGITHIGGGRFRGATHKPITHRVYIAFRDDQVLPYFDPKFTKAQEKQKLETLKRSIKALKEQNALLKGQAITTEAHPRGFATNPYIPAGERP